MASLFTMSKVKQSLLGAASALVLTAVAPAIAEPVTVVELFTSQGCNSCPPANENLAAIAGRPGVLALSYGVTYWDKLGWKDTFASPAYTDRQYRYVRPLGNSSPFTPQIVVNGRADIVGNRIEPLRSLIAKSGPADALDVRLDAANATVGAGEAPGGQADVWLVRYDPALVKVPVGRGENGGRTLPHKNVVHGLQRLGSWTGAAKSFRLPEAGSGLRTAVLVQGRNGGPILGAAAN